MKEWKRVIEAKGRKFLFSMETSHRSEDYQKFEDLRNEIWGFPEDHLSGSRNLMCENYLHEGTSLFIGVYREGEEGKFLEDSGHLVGFSYGFVGVKDKDTGFRSPDNFLFYSQYTGVKPGFQGYGLGILIKEFQREIVLNLYGISVITCTYDPLTGVNAYRNVHHFGMKVVEYREAIYGEYGGYLNRLDVPSDRFFMSWDLKAGRPKRDYDFRGMLTGEHLVIRAEKTRVQGRSHSVFLEKIQEVRMDLDSEYLLVQIPLDFYLMLRETDVDDREVRNIPLEWRLRTREVFKDLFCRGYEIVDFRTSGQGEKRDFYVLKKANKHRPRRPDFERGDLSFFFF